MFLFAKDIDHGSDLRADLVIVGGGAAGITIARHFAGKKTKVLLLESGGEAFDESVQSLYRGDRTGIQVDPPLDASRLRFFGGTTNHWTGWCRPLETWDFERRADWPESGWPITRVELDSYYRAAAGVCQLGPVEFNDPEVWRGKPGGGRIGVLPFDAGKFRTAIFEVSPSVRFGAAYGPELKAAPNVRVVFDANVMEFLPASGHHPDQAEKRVSRARVQTLSGNSFTASGKAFVLAAGGIETARLLLLSDRIHPNGAGNERDLVGRYFMDHPWLNANCYLHLSHAKDLPFYFDQLKVAGAQLFGAIAPTRALCEREHIGGFRLWLNPATDSTEGIESAHEIGKSLAQGKLPDNFLADLGHMIADIDVLAEATYKTIFHTNKGWRSRDSKTTPTGAWIDLNFEQRPNPASRVSLSAERDRLGQRRARVDWQLADTDRRTATRSLELIAQEFGRIGLGRCRINLDSSKNASWPSNMISSCHHSGTARMSETAQTGVVNADCRVHSIDNLYIAGSAVFPTAGYANPTLTIVALALRLADHLDRIVA